MQKRLAVTALAVSFVAATAAGARAELVQAQSVSDTLSGTALLSNNAVPVAGNAVSINGLYAVDVTLSNLGTANTTQVLAVTYAPNLANGEVHFFFVGGPQTTGVTLTQLDFYRVGFYNPGTDTGQRATINVSAALSGTTPTWLMISPTALTFNGGMPTQDIVLYDAVRAVFTFTTPGTSRLQIDYIANPEPGTMALFGLGAAGLGAFVWRRRKSKKPAA